MPSRSLTKRAVVAAAILTAALAPSVFGDTQIVGALSEPAALLQQVQGESTESESRESRDVAPVIEFRDPALEARFADLLQKGRTGTIDDLGLNPVGAVTRAPGLETSRVASARVNGQVSVTYVGSVPGDVQAVVNAAAAGWNSVLTLHPDAPLEIQFRWTPLGRGLLGQAGPNGQFRDPSVWPTDRWYPAALANAIDGTDVNGASQPEISVELNSSLGAEWNVNLSANPSFGQLDLYSVVLHEIGHGLGFLGSAFQSGSAPTLDLNPPDIYDDLVYTADGQRLVDLGDASSPLLTSGTLQIEIGGGRRYPLHSPANFVNGSSYSHFSETIVSGQPGSMMTPALSNGESERNLDAAVLGVLEGIGWQITPPPISPVLSELTVSGSSVSLSWAEDLTQAGTPAHTFRVEAQHPGGVDATLDLPGASSTAQLNGLIGGRGYNAVVTPLNRRGLPGTAAQLPFSTGETIARVTGVRVSGGSNAPLVSWQPVTASGAVTYEIQYRLGAGAWQNVGSTGAAQLQLGSVPTGVYWFSVTPRSGEAVGERSVSPPIGLAPGIRRPMPLDAQIIRLYQAYFLREPDPSGFDFWRNSTLDGVSLPRISAAFEGSEEFQQRYGNLTNRQFVDLVYQNVLGRAPDAAGANYWTGLLNQGTTRGRVMLQFSESPEYITKTGTVMFQDSNQGAAARLYMASFQRPGSPDEIEFWRQQLLAGVSLTAVADQLSVDPEFVAIYGGLSNDAYVVRLYQDLLGRNPNATETEGQLGLLNGGASRGAVLTGFSESREFILITGTNP